MTTPSSSLRRTELAGALQQWGQHDNGPVSEPLANLLAHAAYPEPSHPDADLDELIRSHALDLRGLNITDDLADEAITALEALLAAAHTRNDIRWASELTDGLCGRPT